MPTSDAPARFGNARGWVPGATFSWGYGFAWLRECSEMMWKSLVYSKKEANHNFGHWLFCGLLPEVFVVPAQRAGVGNGEAMRGTWMGKPVPKCQPLPPTHVRCVYLRSSLAGWSTHMVCFHCHLQHTQYTYIHIKMRKSLPWMIMHVL